MRHVLVLGEEGLPHNKDGGCLSYLSGVIEAVLVLSLSVLSRTHVTGDNNKNWYLLWEETIQATPTKQYLGISISLKFRRAFPSVYMGVPSGGLVVPSGGLVGPLGGLGVPSGGLQGSK